MRRQRTDGAFDHFSDGVLAESADLTDEPVVQRRRKIPRRVDDGACSHQYATPKELHRQMYFEAIDMVCEDISTRFHQKDIKVVAEMGNLFTSFCKWPLLSYP